VDRPAIRRLMHHVRRGEIEVVIAYELDRISRSLRDFCEFWGVLQEHTVTFVSATQASAPVRDRLRRLPLLDDFRNWLASEECLELARLAG
jgi:DNA invertase Pin-like site-specific DNA recombinase